MTTGQHLGWVLGCALLSGHRTRKGAVKDELLAQLQVNSQLRGCFELMLLLSSYLGRQLEQCGQCNRAGCYTNKEWALICLQPRDLPLEIAYQVCASAQMPASCSTASHTDQRSLSSHACT